MSVKYGSTTNLITKQIPIAGKSVASMPPDYIRPSDWLTLPTVGLTDQIFVGLLAVTNNDGNYLALLATVSTGTYTVDWGDGSSPQTYTSNTKAQYQYTYSSISDTTISARGYKQVIVTVTASTGNLNSINLQQAHSFLVASCKSNWLDITVGSPFMTGLVIGGNTITTRLTMLEQVSVISINNTTFNTSNWNGFFKNCIALQSCPTLATNNTRSTNMDSMFQDCVALRKAPDMVTTYVTNMGQMFYGCIALEYIPDYDCTALTQISGFSNGFAQNCTNLKRAPNLDLSRVTKTDYMFSGCRSLTQVPNYNLSNSTSSASMFTGCQSITTIPYLKTPNLANAASMFSGCSRLESIYAIDTGNLTNADTMFSTCFVLDNIPNLNLNKLIKADSMFNLCRNIGYFPTMDLPNATSANSMFASCSSMIETPSIIAPKLINATGLFTSCTGLQLANNINLPNLTNATSMFASCSDLQYVNNINLPNVTNASYMFQNCTNLIEMPNGFTGNKVTIATAMFFSCSQLTNISDTLNMGNVADATQMFLSCNRLGSVDNIFTTKLTSTLQMFGSCQSLTNVGNLNFANVTNTGSIFDNSVNLARSDIVNTKTSITYSNCTLSKAALETIFTNLMGNATAQSIGITSNPGSSATTGNGLVSLATRCNYTQGQGVITVTTGDTSTLAVGMICVVGTGWQTIACTFTNGDPVIICNQHGMSAGQTVSFAASGGTTILLNTLYTIAGVQASGNGFTIQQYGGGGAELIPTAGGSTTVRRVATIDSLTTTTITMSCFSDSTLTAQTLTFRRLNTRLASLKNWTITG